MEGWIGLTIIRGISRERPLDYRVAIGIDERYLHRQISENQRFVTVYRMHDMHPSTPQNLELILEGYARTGAVLLMPAEFRADQPGFPMTRENLMLAIELMHLEVVNAWEVGPGSHILSAMQGIVDPVVPPNISDPPFFEALELMRKFAESRSR